MTSTRRCRRHQPSLGNFACTREHVRLMTALASLISRSRTKVGVARIRTTPISKQEMIWRYGLTCVMVIPSCWNIIQMKTIDFRMSLSCDKVSQSSSICQLILSLNSSVRHSREIQSWATTSTKHLLNSEKRSWKAPKSKWLEARRLMVIVLTSLGATPWTPGSLLHKTCQL